MRFAGVLRIAVLTSLVGLLEAACRLGFVDRNAVIAPSQMVRGAVRLLASGDYTTDIGLTLGTVAAAFVLSVIGGFAGGVLLHRLPRLQRAVDPMLVSYYAVPTFIFYPLFIALFGLNRWPLVAIGFIFAVVAMMVSTVDGLARVPTVLRRTARAMRLTLGQELVRIVLPAAAPYLFTGVKLALVYAFIGVIAGEFVMSGAGIGYRVAFAYNAFDNPTMYGLMLLVIGFVASLNMILWSFERRLYARRGGR